MRSALAILDQVIATYPVAIDQIYVTGLSMGGFGTWDALHRRPGKFAAALPLSGGGNKSQGASFKDVPIWLYHGSSDTVVPTRGSDEMQNAIVAAGGLLNTRGLTQATQVGGRSIIIGLIAMGQDNRS